MDIISNKVAHDIPVSLKKLKENEKITSLGVSDKRMSEKLFNDFADIKNINKDFNSRLLSNNTKLSIYEEEMSKNQYMTERANLLENSLKQGKLSEFNEIVGSSIFKDENPLSVFFTKQDEPLSQLSHLRSAISLTDEKLKRDFKAIEISSQNFLSLNTYSTEINMTGIQNPGIFKPDSINNRRVMDLIS